ncbi:hypothetical protein NECAME_13963 [Necator americanus]|uniref:Uncharacterized protein n=1 Tax=Necator americanus TaxID=51031 RepID=W2STH8_NECAM|nr:hypothetical protein NECAME_13963 [Necator americanus]ETN72156.1 hypothetical protein NECAME_13963 [Necator americanus]
MASGKRSSTTEDEKAHHKRRIIFSNGTDGFKATNIIIDANDSLEKKVESSVQILERKIHINQKIQRSEDIEAQPKRKDRKVRIAIVTVLKKMTDRVQYTTAMTTMECYSKRLNYTYVVTDSSTHLHVCNQTQAWMIELFAAKGKLYTKCIDFWNRSKSYTHLEKFTLCSREALKIADTSKVLILKEGKGWCRDAWLTNSHWNPETDFMFHAWKEVNKLPPENKKVGVLSGPEFYPWFNTLKTPLTKSQCLSGGDDWTHDADFIVPVSQLQAHLNQKLENVERSYQHLREQLKL